MENQLEIKQIVKEKYGDIARNSKDTVCGCSCGCGSSYKIVDYSMMSDDYSKLDGYAEDADLGLGCGLPTEYANLNKGDIVVDLGSGAGNDAFIAAAIVGNVGKVIGIDMTVEMTELANQNKAKLGYNNVEFKLGEIESLPLDNNSTNVVISNCVLNLVPNKERAFGEIYRVLKENGHFCVSDIVLVGELSDNLKKSAEMYAGCVAGAIQKDEYLNIIKETGFKNVEIKQTKTIKIPDDVIVQYLNSNQVLEFRNSNIGIYSITVVGYK
jgi:SAM-dependent methyltransferase